MMFAKPENRKQGKKVLKKLDELAAQQVDQILLSIYEKGQVKHLTKVALGDQHGQFNNDAFENDYVGLNPSRHQRNRLTGANNTQT